MVPYYFHTSPSCFHSGGGAAADKEKGEPITLSAGTPFRFRGEPESAAISVAAASKRGAGFCVSTTAALLNAAAVVFLPGEIWKAKQEQVEAEISNIYDSKASTSPLPEVE